MKIIGEFATKRISSTVSKLYCQQLIEGCVSENSQSRANFSYKQTSFRNDRKANEGGVLSVFAKRFVITNNKFVSSYDPSSKPSTFLFIIGANAFHGGIIEQFNSFEFNETIIIEEICKTSRKSEMGYILNVEITTAITCMLIIRTTH